MTYSAKFKLCTECGEFLSPNPEFIRDIYTNDLIPVCKKCAQILPKLHNTGIDQEQEKNNE